MAEIKGTVCIDLDGVLAEYHGWKQNSSNPIGKPLPGAVEFLGLVGQDYSIVIHTTRPWAASTNEHTYGIQCVRTWLKTYCSHLPHFVFERIKSSGSEKPKALVYIDDRGFRFTGNNWHEAYEMITQPAHWEESDATSQD
jgi:hypothetical protein